MTDVSVIIVNYNTMRMTCECINSIINHTHDIKYEIIVVDNSSTDGSRDLFTKDLRIKYIYNEENLGFGQANNIGIKVATSRNIFFLNPDTKLLNNSIKILSNYLDRNPDVGACGGNLYDEQLFPVHSFRRNLPSLFSELSLLFARYPEKLLYGNSTDFNYTKRPIPVGYITGADLMVKTSVLEECGSFSSDYFMYYEETDLCCRIKSMNYNIVSIPTAAIQHLEGKSFKADPNAINKKRISLIEKGRLIYYKNHHSRLHAAIAHRIYCLYLFSHRLIQKDPIAKEAFMWRLFSAKLSYNEVFSKNKL